MSQRERILAALVVVVLLAVVGFFVLKRVQATFTARQSEISQLEQQIHEKELTELVGQKASDKISHYQQRSLPGPLEYARSQYQEWLLRTTEDFFGDNDVVVRQGATAPQRIPGAQDVVYTRLDFDVSAIGNLDQLTRFLYRFYDVNYLHRIQRLQVDPIRDSKYLNISCKVEALLVRGTTRKELDDEKGDRLAFDSLEDYQRIVLDRNLFGQPNNAPQFDRLRSQSVDVGSSYRQTITVRETDLLDRVSIKLDKGPPGMRLEEVPAPNAEPGDPWTATLSWLPREEGTYDVSIVASDDGLPNKTARLDFTIEVRQPRPPETVDRGPPPPAFDKAKYTFLGSVQAINGEPEVWFYDRTTGDSEDNGRKGLPQRFICHEGDEIAVGEFRALVRRIQLDPPHVELEVEDELLVVELGKNLREGVVKTIPQIGQTSPAPDKAAPID